MNISNSAKAVNIIQCPVCESSMVPSVSGIACTAGHQFDQSKSGYVNLLLAQNKKTIQPGDSKEMVNARTHFLNLNRYAPLAEMLVQAADRFWPDVEKWADIGCGDGWYTRKVKSHLNDTTGFGIDISKFAVQAACKTPHDMSWLVASASKLPFVTHSLDGAMVVMAKIMPDELIRCMKPGAILLTIGTAKDHLIQLRKFLYPTVKLTDFDGKTALNDAFVEVYSKEVNFEWIPDSLEELTNLLTMTPHHWRASPERKEQLHQLINLPMTGHFRLQAWEVQPVDDSE